MQQDGCRANPLIEREVVPMGKDVIPEEVRKRATDCIAEFNRKNSPDGNVAYVARFKGKCLYLDREEYGRLGPICRLTWTGNEKRWKFAIFRYSDDRYDPEEWFFPGSEKVDGTIEGAMWAGLEAYPP
jgi:hypothetical protein